MICTKCRQNISPDCVLIGDFLQDEKKVLEQAICVFCYYNITEWDSNGQLITRFEAIRPSLCPYCSRPVPNVDWLLKRGCIWCQRP
jgi:hypothetical protein